MSAQRACATRKSRFRGDVVFIGEDYVLRMGVAKYEVFRTKECMMHKQHAATTTDFHKHSPEGHNGNGHRNAESPAMKVPATFCPEGVEPFDTVEWERRSAQIKDENGDILFEQTDCEIPADWSSLATNVVVSKYFFGEPDTDERETSVRQLIHRVVRTITDWGIKDGYFASVDD